MDIGQIKEIAAAMKENGLTAFEITEGDTILRMERQPAPAAAGIPLPFTPEQAEHTPVPANSTAGGAEIKSPMVGVFYLRPSPDSEPYVQVGSKVKKGDTLCVIEAMKLLNEIIAERDGEIMEIRAQDGQMVEYAQVLFQMV